MQILRPRSLAELLERATPFLITREAEHGLMLGVAAATGTLAPDGYAALALEGDDVVGAALRTASALIVSREGAPDAMACLAADAGSPLLHRVLGPPDSVERFTRAYGRPFTPFMAQGIYECSGVRAMPTPRGAHRLARMDDREQVAEWIRGLSIEALNEPMTMDEASARAAGHIERGSMHVWEADAGLVSVAAAVAPTPHGIRVNNVYTPPEQRSQGYAGALVASLTQAMLDAGRAFVFLHTDLANPTSNRLYERIGYRRVAEFAAVSIGVLP